MSNSVHGRSYNVRVSFTDEGEPVIGMVQGFYNVKAECYDIRPVPEGIVMQIARKLGIEKSSKSLKFNRQAAKAKRQEEKQNTFLFENQALS